MMKEALSDNINYLLAVETDGIAGQITSCGLQ
jgi:hypothetical protein